MAHQPVLNGGYMVTRDRRIRYVFGQAHRGDVIPASAAMLLNDFEALSADGSLRYFSDYSEARAYAARISKAGLRRA